MVVKGCSLRAVIREANRVGSHKPPIAHFFVLTVHSLLFSYIYINYVDSHLRSLSGSNFSFTESTFNNKTFMV